MADDAAPPPPAADAPAPAPAPEPRTAFAVLTAPRGELTAGQVVFGPSDAVDALVASGAAEAATAWQMDVSAPFHFPIPEA